MRGALLSQLRLQVLPEALLKALRAAPLKGLLQALSAALVAFAAAAAAASRPPVPPPPPANAPAATPAGSSPIAQFSTAAPGEPPPPWRHVTLPKQPRHTRYAIVEDAGTRVLRIDADGSYSNLLHPLAQPLEATPILRWRWRVDALPAGADLTRRSGDDGAARLCVLFNLPLERLSFTDRLKVRLGRRLFDPALPAAAICYVWDSDMAAGTWLPNAYTARVQMLVLRSRRSGDPVGGWSGEARDLRADFARAFPHEAGNGPLPALAAIGVAADGDNTGGTARSFFGDLTLDRAP